MMVTMQSDRFVPIPLAEFLDPETGRTGVRMVDTSSTRYTIAQRYMIRLRQSDMEPPAVDALAEVCGISPEEFREEFGEVAAWG